jgi:glycosyltransferase involved in cell wall biosynthesis
MSDTPSYVIITPVRNEERNFPRTIESVVAQTWRPAKWVIVDDGSTDATGQIADAAAARHDWIRVVHLHDRGFRQPGTGVIQAFYEAYPLIEGLSWDFLAKLDGDLAFEPGYFERCFELFREDPGLGIGGGLVCRLHESSWVVDSAGDPAFHVRGATKIYRRTCWEQIGGLIRAPGWDTVDELKANMLGWQTRTFPDLRVQQLKDTGSADGAWRNWVKNGQANYVTGYHPLFMAAKCLRRCIHPPYFLAACGLAWGFCKGYLVRARRVEDPPLIQFVRQQQMRRLMLRPSIWN